MSSRGTGAKQEQLIALEKRMKRRFARKFPESDLWFFEGDCGAVAGYLGTDPVMFVGQRPSRGKGPAAKAFVGGFYGLLADYGFANAHITDVVKESQRDDEGGTPSWEQVERNWPFFKEELEIIRPTVVVALGGWVDWALQQRVPSYLMPTERITHYSYRFIGRAEKENRLHADLARIRRKVDAIVGNCCREND